MILFSMFTCGFAFFFLIGGTVCLIYLDDGDFVLLNYADLIAEISVFFGGWRLPSYHQVSCFMYWGTL